MGVFSEVQFSRLMVIAYYRRILMYTKIYRNKGVEGGTGKREMSVNEEEFQTYAVHIRDEMEDSNWKSYHSWILPESFNSLRYNNDLQ